MSEMAEERNARPRDRSYAVVTRDTVSLYAESVGLANLPNELLDMLAEDVSYRLRDVIQQSFEFMRLSRRRKLTADDFNKALKHSDIQPIYGYGSKEAGVALLPTSEGELFYPDDPVVSLASIVSTDEVPVSLPSLQLKANWLAVEGVPSTTLQSKSNIGRMVKSVSEDLLMYYDIFTKAVLGTDSAVMKHALSNLMVSNKVSPLLAYFVNFVSNGVRTVSHDTSQLSRLLYTVKALITNRNLFLQPKPYLTMLTQTILYCQLEPLAASINSVSDHWILRDYAAILLAQTIRRWDTPTNKLRQNNKKLFGDILSDRSRPLCSHYGALMGLLALGLDAVKDILVPKLPAYLDQLTAILNDSSTSNAFVRSDVQHILGALTLCADFLVRSERQSMLETVPDWNVSSAEPQPSVTKPTEIYTVIYDYVGDSLAARLAICQIPFRTAADRPSFSRRDANVLEKDSSADQTGEQLLQQFLEPPTRSERSSERSSPTSSIAEGDADLAIKETVSDPTRGIRLTILKRPKLRPTDDMPVLKKTKLDEEPSPTVHGPNSSGAASTSGKQTAADQRKLEMPTLKSSRAGSSATTRVKHTLNDVFEDLVTKTRCNASQQPGRRDSSVASDIIFVFRFQGRVQECVAPTGPRLLPRWGIPRRTTLSWYQVLCRRSRFIDRMPRLAAKTKLTVARDNAGTNALPSKLDRCGGCSLNLAWTLL